MDFSESEIKYTISNQYSRQVTEWLSSRCVAAEPYHAQTISSIYYDTLGWKSLGEKINSDYLKTKVRLRWYSDLAYQCHFEPSFAEAKFRVGTKRHKVRIPSPLSGEQIANTALDHAVYLQIPSLLASNNIVLGQNYFPAYQISYKRLRFKEPLTGNTICFDYDIRASRINTFMLPQSCPFALHTAVLELKGNVDGMPTSLHTLVHMGCQRNSFSKYFACYQKMMGRAA